MIQALITLAGSVISGLVAIYVCTVQNNKSMALIEYRMAQLEAKVDKHNNLVERMYSVEAKLKAME